MNVRVLKRIKTLEQMVMQANEPPSLVSIFFDENKNKWSVTEYYIPKKHSGANSCKSTTTYHEHLRDYFFPAEFNGRVIMDTFASPEPEIYGNLFAFDMDDIRAGQVGELSIQSMLNTDEQTLDVEITTLVR